MSKSREEWGLINRISRKEYTQVSLEYSSVKLIIKDSMIPNNCTRFYTTFCV